jgi:hypothetical protein
MKRGMHYPQYEEDGGIERLELHLFALPINIKILNINRFLWLK